MEYKWYIITLTIRTAYIYKQSIWLFLSDFDDSFLLHLEIKNPSKYDFF